VALKLSDACLPKDQLLDCVCPPGPAIAVGTAPGCPPESPEESPSSGATLPDKPSFYVRIDVTVGPLKKLLCREYWNAIWLDLDDLHPPSCQCNDVSRRRPMLRFTFHSGIVT
jgi:hypothetical protein